VSGSANTICGSAFLQIPQIADRLSEAATEDLDIVYRRVAIKLSNKTGTVGEQG
jgi:hypothetical protein